MGSPGAHYQRHNRWKSCNTPTALRALFKQMTSYNIPPSSERSAESITAAISIWKLQSLISPVGYVPHSAKQSSPEPSSTNRFASWMPRRVSAFSCHSPWLTVTDFCSYNVYPDQSRLDCTSHPPPLDNYCTLPSPENLTSKCNRQFGEMVQMAYRLSTTEQRRAHMYRDEEASRSKKGFTPKRGQRQIRGTNARNGGG